MFFSKRSSRLSWRLRLCATLPLVTLYFCFVISKADAAELVKVYRDGRETALYEKLITIGANTPVLQAADGSGKAQYVGAFNIFYHAKSDDGKSESLGHYRIATQSGRPLGWVKKEDVQVWGTRFAIDPITPFDGNEFRVDLEVGGQAIYDPADIPDSAAAYSFILGPTIGSGQGAEDDGPFPVCFCVALQSSQGTEAEANQIANMQLEVVFVLETGDFLLSEYGGKELIAYVRALAEKYVETIKKTAIGGSVPTRLGLVTYQDTNEFAPQKRPLVMQPLTEDLSRWKSKVDAIKPDIIGGDWPEDGLSGVALAVSNQVGWKENSSKHIVLIGKGSFQTQGIHEGGRPFNHYMAWMGDRSHSIWKEIGWDKMFGYNSSGKSESDIHYDAFPQGGATGSKLRQTKHIHTIRVGENIETSLIRELGSRDKYYELENAIKDVESKLRTVPEDDVIAAYAENEELRELLNMLWWLKQEEFYENVALSQYESLAKAGDTPGYFAACSPEEADVMRVVGELRKKIENAIKVVGEVAKGNLDKVGTAGSQGYGDEFSKPIFRIVNSSLKSSEVIKKPVQTGTAAVRSETSGRLVGHKVIMVSEEEINRLMGTFNSLYEQFDKKRARAARQDVTSILTDLKASLAQATSGQTLDASTKLADLITDLPLRTSALMMTPGDIAVMGSQDFEAWLGELKLAEQRTRMLLSGDASRWITISSLGQATDKYAFLKVSELP